MTEKKINSRKIGLIVLLLSLVLIVCAAPASGAFITITNCPETVTQGAILTISGDAPGINTLKLTLSSLSIQTLNPMTFHATVNSDDSYSFSIDTSNLAGGQYQAVVSPESFKKGQSTTFDLMAKVAFIVIGKSLTPSPTQDYSSPYLTATIDKIDVESDDIVTISVTTSGTSEIEYILIGPSYWEYNYFDTPEKSTIIEIDTSILPPGEYAVYIIHPKDRSFDVRADNDAIMFKGYYGTSFENLYGKQGENRVDTYLQQANDLSKKLKFTVNEKEASGVNKDDMSLIIIGLILAVIFVGGLIAWFVHGVLKQSKIQKAASATENTTKEEPAAKTEPVTKRIEINNVAKKYCSNCGAEISDDYSFCLKCGAKIEAVEAKAKCCPNCGAEVSDDYLFCKKCGKKL